MQRKDILEDILNVLQKGKLRHLWLNSMKQEDLLRHSKLVLSRKPKVCFFISEEKELLSCSL